MNLKKEMACRKIPMRALGNFIEDDNAELGALLSEYTKAALIIGLVLVPIGIGTLIAMNTSGMSTSMVLALGSIGMIIVASVIMAILDRSMKSGKKSRK
jgi:hypothetical protein